MVYGVLEYYALCCCDASCLVRHVICYFQYFHLVLMTWCMALGAK